jgi:PIN domain
VAGIKKLLFVDTNIWLDFYRPAKSDAILKLLQHLESVRDHIIATHQLEMEFKKNRQGVILEGIKSLVPPAPIATQGVLSDAKAKRAIEKNVKAIATRVTGLKKRMMRLLADPVHHDPVYQVRIPLIVNAVST